MAKKNLVIVESPAKAKTIEKILGNKFQVVSSFGHLKDLPKSKLGVDVENDFQPSYSTIKGKGEIIKKLKDLKKKSDKVYLASDPDREGESIAWHIANTLKLDNSDKNRIEFNEITEQAIKNAVKNPRKINLNRVNSQQARRILDRLVGYEISPLLWKLISSNTSAGRVQSVALKLICDLEDTIKAFVPEKFWNIKGKFSDLIELDLYKVNDKKIDKLKDEAVVKKIKTLKNKEFLVISSKVSKKSKKPPLPLKTSTLQQLASSYLGYSASRTMMLAQKLYEGIDIEKKGNIGLITYMRTDSTRISDDAKQMAKDYILKEFGKEYLGVPETKTTKKQNVQDAHESIRPTNIELHPDKLSKYLDKDQLKLYKLIWERFLISQLAPVKYEQFELILEKDEIQFRGTMNNILFDGYYKIFKEKDEIMAANFPNIKENELLKLTKLNIKEDFTKPPARFTEASLVKTLESEGIGRPSTYASILETLKKREYVIFEGKTVSPTEIGNEVKLTLEKYFPNIMNIKFTAELENNLDSVDGGDKDWITLLHTFYDDLLEHMKKFKVDVEKETSRIVMSDVKCKKSDDFMIMKIGRFGKYLISPNGEDEEEKISLRGIDIPLADIKNGKIYVKDKVEESQKKKIGRMTDVKTEDGTELLLKFGRFGNYLESVNFKEDGKRVSIPREIIGKLIKNEIKIENDVVLLKDEMDKVLEYEKKLIKEAGKCEKCGKAFKVGNGRWGKFLACVGYPECKNIRKIKKD